MNIVNITSDYAVSGPLRQEDFAHLARKGFQTIINFQSEDEPSVVLQPDDARRLATAEGMNYVHIPTPKHELFSPSFVGATREAFKSFEGPVLGSCASGQRAAIAWAGAKSRVAPVHEVMATLSAAGFDFGFLREELRMLAGAGRSQGEHSSMHRDMSPPQALA